MQFFRTVYKKLTEKHVGCWLILLTFLLALFYCVTSTCCCCGVRCRGSSAIHGCSTTRERWVAGRGEPTGRHFTTADGAGGGAAAGVNGVNIQPKSISPTAIWEATLIWALISSAFWEQIQTFWPHDGRINRASSSNVPNRFAYCASNNSNIEFGSESCKYPRTWCICCTATWLN